jgi:hypothetical protein
MKALRIGVVVFLGAAALLWAGAALALEPDVRCEAEKNKEAGKYAHCRLNFESKGVKKGAAPEVAKCDKRFQKTWGKIEKKGRGLCPTEGDQAQMQAFIADCTDCISDYLSGAVVWCDCLLGMPPTTTTTTTTTSTTTTVP